MGYFRGFAVTFRKMFEKRVTTPYPKQKRDKPARFHGRHVLNRYEDGLGRASAIFNAQQRIWHFSHCCRCRSWYCCGFWYVTFSLWLVVETFLLHSLRDYRVSFHMGIF